MAPKNENEHRDTRETPNAPEVSAPLRAPDGTEHTEPDANAPNAPGQSVPADALNKALLRTFRTDVAQELGEELAPPPSVPKDTPAQAPSSAPTPQQPKERNKAIVHTFRDDVQNLVRTQKVSLTKMAALESDSDASAPTYGAAPAPRRRLASIMLSVALLIAAVGIGFGAYYAYQLNTTPLTSAQPVQAMFFTEARESIDVTGGGPRDILTLLASARRDILFSLGSVVELYLVREETLPEGGTQIVRLGAAELLARLNARVPETFTETLNPDYILGIHIIEENVPFMVFTTRSYGHTFAGMFEWEQHIEEDLMPFLSPGAMMVTPATAQASNTFGDTVIDNLDVRILRDGAGDIRVLYAFVNRTTVIITTNIRTLLEVASRVRIADGG